MDNENMLYMALALVGGGVLGYFISTSGILSPVTAQETQKPQSGLGGLGNLIPCGNKNNPQK